jgi:phosphatidylserine/phosphatidylglycerophosphate/cardiolipin synthase-like enzyme
VKVLTGSTNFSVTGIYVNANHVIVFNDPKVAAKYSEVFEQVWTDEAKRNTFQKSELATNQFPFSSKATPRTEITFAPHPKDFAATILTDLTARIAKEGKKGKTTGSVLFAVMALNTGTGPVLPALEELHKDQSIFSFGISDSPKGIFLYTPGKKEGVLVTGRPTSTQLPPPFDQVPGVGIGHQVHHKFIVCGFNGADPVVYCGSSNLASGGEESNGDNLLAIHDGDVATAFAIEALALVDHFNFLDRFAKAPKAPKNARTNPPAATQQAAASAGWFLSTTDKWVAPYYDSNDLHFMDRQIFA